MYRVASPPTCGLIRAPQGLRTAQIFIAISAVLYGTQGIFASVAYDHGASVGVLLAVRAALFLVLALFLLNPARRATLRGHRRPVAIACFTSIAGPALYFAAVQRMDPATVTLILFIYPALTVVGAGLLGRVHLTLLALLVKSVTVVGVALAIGSPVGSIDIVGVLLTLAFACIVAGYFLVAEKGLEGVDPLAWLGITVLAAAVFLIPGGLLLGERATPDATGWLALLGVAVVSSIIACLFQTSGLMRLGSAATALVACLEIATVVLLSYLVLDEQPGLVSLIGAVLVIVGATLAPIAVRRRISTGGSAVKPGATP
jgi:drug/metabolite transporter (DMT)-like permease